MTAINKIDKWRRAYWQQKLLLKKFGNDGIKMQNLLMFWKVYLNIFGKSDGDVDIKRGKEGGNLMASQIQSAAQPDSLHA